MRHELAEDRQVILNQKGEIIRELDEIITYNSEFIKIKESFSGIIKVIDKVDRDSV